MPFASSPMPIWTFTKVPRPSMYPVNSNDALMSLDGLMTSARAKSEFGRLCSCWRLFATCILAGRDIVAARVAGMTESAVKKAAA